MVLNRADSKSQNQKLDLILISRVRIVRKMSADLIHRICFDCRIIFPENAIKNNQANSQKAEQFTKDIPDTK